MKNLLFLSLIRWHSLFQRPQQIATHWPKDWLITWIEPATLGVQNAWQPEQEGRVVRSAVFCLPHHAKLPMIRGWANLLGKSKFLRSRIEAGANRRVRKILNALKTPKPDAILIHHPQMRPILDLFPDTPVLFDYMDDIFSFEGTPQYYTEYLQAILDRANIVTASSARLVEDLQQRKEREVTEISNGVDLKTFFSRASKDIPTELKALPKPIICYAGSIAYWMDFEILEQLAAEFDNGTLLLIGPVYIDVQEEFEKLKRRSNVRYVAPLSYGTLACYLSIADIALIPFKINDLTLSVNPNKLYEYGALELPVISTHLPSVETHSHGVWLGKTPEDFVKAAKEILDNKKLRKQRTTYLRQLAEQNSWEKSAKKMYELLFG